MKTVKVHVGSLELGCDRETTLEFEDDISDKLMMAAIEAWVLAHAEWDFEILSDKKKPEQVGLSGG